jgi:hypothetical protein
MVVGYVGRWNLGVVLVGGGCNRCFMVNGNKVRGEVRRI